MFKDLEEGPFDWRVVMEGHRAWMRRKRNETLKRGLDVILSALEHRSGVVSRGMRCCNF